MIKKLIQILLFQNKSNNKANLLSGYRAYTRIPHPIKTHQKSNQNKYSEVSAHIKNIAFLVLPIK